MSLAIAVLVSWWLLMILLPAPVMMITAAFMYCYYREGWANTPASGPFRKQYRR